jgi:predicted regulator of Ras-like GTPase activity (Roadblock/LC7/MglB family)
VSWFDDLAGNPHVEVALLVDNLGTLVAASDSANDEARRVASMIKAAEVLARGLSVELGRGEMRAMQLSTAQAHLLVTPVGLSHYLIVLINKNAPMELLSVYLKRLTDRLSEDEIRSATTSLDDLDAAEIIQAVTEWLHSGGDSGGDRAN